MCPAGIIVSCLACVSTINARDIVNMEVITILKV